MTVLVRTVSLFPSEGAAEALKAEFYRIPSSPATRTYLNEVSVKWRRRFEEAAWRLDD